jgi:hypothetical protein
MSALSQRSRGFAACFALLAPLAVASAARADKGGHAAGAPMMMQAAAAPAYHNPCDDSNIENPFTQWDDSADYFLIRGGDVSNLAPDWSFDGGGVVDENNTDSAHGEETASASLGAGDSVTAPSVCVSVDDPTMRFFVRNTGAATGTLRVEALYTDQSFETHAIQLGTLTSADAGDAWTPSPILELAAPLDALLDDGVTPVRFRFSADGAGSAWLVDDVYVDPYGKG